jgi:hypothetical protein
MSEVEKKVMVAKESYELFELIAMIIIEIKRAGEQDDKASKSEVIAKLLPVIVQYLPQALDGIDQLDEEFKKDPFSIVNSLMINVGNVFNEIKK